MILSQHYIDNLIYKALDEDINYIDISSAYIFTDDMKSTAYFVSKADGVLAGIDVALRVFELLDKDVVINKICKDGDKITKGTEIATIEGKTAMLLKGERTALNILQHMSGIATAVSKAVEAVSHTNATIADTRKTLPGLRPLQKYAVTCGGGKNHRYNLSDAVMLKDNHIDAGGGISKTVKTVRQHIGHTVTIEVETRNLAEVKEALDAGADIIMLDNMTVDEMKEAVKLIGGRAKTEASGNITLDNIKEVAETGVDIISMGAITHSVKAFDISMKIRN
ncbi:MAG TPA: carboxylating nicotinate-nucleotide diphosphorylase [Clostridiales bacterium]|jgi:nicotinate-nucleotide pyrophosphorylase (carboxylating)|nr:carboxylating nicotinate-nucleotide diphosphorylase [Clostridiales bacterium]HPP68429.1 carboxylating nicotinate-nucleotide diphosphorylase [Clostridiales bacterium]HPU67083.1 carboxylating nicotinate-nucleotide diphosphorylase [Clostridiales bacterium]HQD72229.1 carboxylating nicotinate-nucleotide diphosphorylase [Clostridiales bacterium]HXK83877.1 carboxylating nicotinate-nucleotide diphosphorylase [Clostridiales bacterium]